jgi:hypothetical protein
MTKWEYAEVVCQRGYPLGDRASVAAWTAGKKREGERLVDMLNDLAREGWEVVTFQLAVDGESDMWVTTVLLRREFVGKSVYEERGLLEV